MHDIGTGCMSPIHSSCMTAGAAISNSDRIYLHNKLVNGKQLSEEDEELLSVITKEFLVYTKYICISE